MWLNAGAAADRGRRRVRTSVVMLVRRYAKCLNVLQDVANRHIEELLREYRHCRTRA
jgi:hypothetical protein